MVRKSSSTCDLGGKGYRLAAQFADSIIIEKPFRSSRAKIHVDLSARRLNTAAVANLDPEAEGGVSVTESVFRGLVRLEIFYGPHNSPPDRSAIQIPLGQ